MNPVYQSLPQIQIFLVVVEKGSFQAAASQLNLPRSSVSKKIQQLEETLGQALFKRSTRRLTITEFGLALAEQTRTLPDIVTRVDRLKEQVHAQPAGKVRISTGIMLGQSCLVPLLAEIRLRMPAIELDISFNDEPVDMLAEGVDIALRTGTLPDSSLIAKQIGQITWCWYASPEYLTRYGQPKTPDDLSQHQCLAFKNSHIAGHHWAFYQPEKETYSVQVKAAITTDNSRALTDMACAGLGIMMITPQVVREEIASGRLVQVLTDWQHPDSAPIHLIGFRKSQRSRAVESVWQYLVKHLKA
ncbi:HTH-type transcriptional regulator DmlR [Vibrio aerogenes CECT 7868]|uniref:HTH-type transcriptional regulator DmlR n=1 Tax=Vibrio aerogenes CECT 7868 TaxID=1216006 RepID=A0A1M6EFJ7_9VIBR|nr:LysR family transcriptional regulator [Vibrio aerogenes]SHI84100.1 HTH-type transcriptional regulator DmlR [Vibrio aerogenes CECT 7868]